MKCKFFFKKYVFLWLYWVLIAACGILVAACGIEFPDQDLNSGLPALGVQRFSHWIIREVSEMQVIEPHPSLTKSETLESSRTSPPGDSSVPRGGEPGLPRGRGAGEVGLVGLGRDFCLHLKDNGKFLEGS